MNLEYNKDIVVSIAAHLIEPFHALTIDVASNRTSLKETFDALHSFLQTCRVTESFFRFAEPAFPGFVSPNLLNKTKTVYKPEVVEAVMSMAEEYEDDCIPPNSGLVPWT